MYGTPTNPLPFIIAAYGIAFVVLAGYGVLLIYQRYRYLQMEQTLKNHDSQ